MSAVPERALTLVIGALGGEGGGVLADWVVETAHAAGYPVQATSIPGVAQRTGATTYYVEIFPLKMDALGGRSPVLCLSPTPGQVDVLVCSELMETARAIQAGLVSARTTLIASTHRVYATAEKMQMGDGRFDSVKAIEAAHACAKQAILFDMERATQAAGTVISAVMFGALVGAGALPLARAAAEAAIRAGGRGADASLKGFAAGFDHAAIGADAQVSDHARVPASDTPGAGVEGFPPAVRDVLSVGVDRCIDYLDRAYASLYLERLQPVLARDLAGGGGPQFALTRESARFLALWMCYEDVARVAQLKSRPERFDAIRAEAGAAPGEPVRVVEFFKPGYPEIADLLPPALGARLMRWAGKRVAVFEDGIHLHSTSMTGYAQLRLLAAAARWRRRSSRYAAEQALIERWLATIVGAKSDALAFETALTARLIKGYSDTHQRGRDNFTRIFDHIVVNESIEPGERAGAVRAAREAALADPESKQLDARLAALGAPARPVKQMPITFHPRAVARQV